MKHKKALFNATFLVLCMALTVHYVFKGEDLGTLIGYIRKASPVWWIPGVLCVLSFVMGESVVMRYLLRSLGENVRLRRCFIYSFVGFFFCLVTPGASGGQPVQLLFMSKDKLPVHLSTLVLLIITIAYKLVLIFFSAIVLAIRPEGMMAALEPARFWLLLGLSLTAISIAIMLALVFRPVIVQKSGMLLFSKLKKITKSPGVHGFETKLTSSLERYGEVAGFLSSHRGIFGRVMVMTTVQRSFLFAVTWFVLLSFGIHTGLFRTIAMQAMISTAVDMLPVPGGMGMSEHLYSMVFLPVCGEELTLPTMIVVRGLTYYTQLFICFVMTVVGFIIVFHGRKDATGR